MQIQPLCARSRSHTVWQWLRQTRPEHARLTRESIRNDDYDSSFLLDSGFSVVFDSSNNEQVNLRI